MELLRRTGVGRDINRHHYTRAEIDEALGRPVVRALLDLIRLRNSHPAFGGEFQVQGTGSSLALSWRNGSAAAVLTADLADRTATIEVTDDAGRTTTCADLLDGTGTLPS
jgi:sucrose phosphorylase